MDDVSEAFKRLEAMTTVINGMVNKNAGPNDPNYNYKSPKAYHTEMAKLNHANGDMGSYAMAKYHEHAANASPDDENNSMLHSLHHGLAMAYQESNGDHRRVGEHINLAKTYMNATNSSPEGGYSAPKKSSKESTIGKKSSERPNRWTNDDGD